MNKHILYAVWCAGIFTLATPNFALWEVTVWTKDAVRRVLCNPTPVNPVVTEEKKVEIIQEVPNLLLAKKKISDMTWTPLDMSWILYKNNLRQFLWLNQYKLIYESYNKEILKKNEKWEILDDKKLYLENEITFPLIFDWLKTTFPESLDDFMTKNEEFKKDVKDSKTVIVITKNPENKFALAYYKEWKLTLATHISPGKISKAKTKEEYNEEIWEIETIVTEKEWINTPTWTFYIKKGEKTFIRYKRSKDYGDAPMPYAIWIAWWTFLHHWANVDGKKRSHWCIRVPGFYQEVLYSMVEDKTKIVIKYTDKKSKS